MKNLFLKIIILFMLLNPYTFLAGYSQDLSIEKQQFSARSFCKNKNGSVTETGISHTFICCYQKKQKCIIINEKKGYSRLIQITHINREQQGEKL